MNYFLSNQPWFRQKFSQNGTMKSWNAKRDDTNELNSSARYLDWRFELFVYWWWVVWMKSKCWFPWPIKLFQPNIRNAKVASQSYGIDMKTKITYLNYVVIIFMLDIRPLRALRNIVESEIKQKSFLFLMIVVLDLRSEFIWIIKWSTKSSRNKVSKEKTHDFHIRICQIQIIFIMPVLWVGKIHQFICIPNMALKLFFRNEIGQIYRKIYVSFQWNCFLSRIIYACRKPDGETFCIKNSNVNYSNSIHDESMV